jgi:uncharacterized protein (TIGR00297 family)
MSNALLILTVFLVAITGYYLKSLTISGAIAACIIGMLVILGYQSEGLALLGMFFGTSSLWSKYKKKAKESIGDLIEKGDQRDYSQVLANGFLPALFSLMHWLIPSNLWLFAFCFSISAANADTWASEIGTLSKKLPFHIFSFRTVTPGTSGAVSFLGLLASVAGAFIIATTAYVVSNLITVTSVVLITFIGFLGSLIDTFIGASIQAKYKCPYCHLITEKKMHCQGNTRLISGFKWINNDVTNFLSILLASGIGSSFILSWIK